MSINEEEALNPQVDKNLYFNPDYLHLGRMAAYSYQFSEIVKLKPKSILEIGIGNGLVSFLLKKAGFSVTTLDFDPSLKPDITASVTNIPCPNNSFDIVACFEVLEHLPYEDFSKALTEIYRVLGEYAILSMPDCNRSYRFAIQIPKLGEFRKLMKLPRVKPPKHTFGGEHHWEIGKDGYPLSRIISDIKRVGFGVEKTFRLFENPYHRFFKLKRAGK